MSAVSHSSDPPVGIGLSSVILGSVGLLLFFMPVLGIPLGAIGLAFGLSGLAMAFLGGQASLRWTVVGIVVSGLALGIGIAIAQAPAGFLPNPQASAVWQSVPDRHYISPPARPGS